ncbi:hypothetical protein U1Q18_042552 [Sarracenia purpurea var. burkii]
MWVSSGALTISFFFKESQATGEGGRSGFQDRSPICSKVGDSRTSEGLHRRKSTLILHSDLGKITGDEITVFSKNFDSRSDSRGILETQQLFSENKKESSVIFLKWGGDIGDRHNLGTLFLSPSPARRPLILFNRCLKIFFCWIRSWFGKDFGSSETFHCAEQVVNLVACIPFASSSEKKTVKWYVPGKERISEAPSLSGEEEA